MTGFTGNKGAQSGLQVRLTALQKGDLAVSTSATGMVYSTSVTQVSSNLNYSVKSVYVSVGDHVNEGDILAEVDTSELESSIAQKKASLNSSQASAQLNLSEAQNNLANYQRDLEAGYDSALMNAQSSVASAEMSVRTAELDLISANVELRTARNNYRDAYNGRAITRRGASESQL
jgi:multidrug efflux pump subunit AcrA (membrane-fusion protein)